MGIYFCCEAVKELLGIVYDMVSTCSLVQSIHIHCDKGHTIAKATLLQLGERTQPIMWLRRDDRPIKICDKARPYKVW